MQEGVERVLVMVARGPDGAQALDKLVRGEEGFQKGISRPSKATSKPAASTAARSAEPSTRIGFVLLMWI